MKPHDCLSCLIEKHEISGLLRMLAYVSIIFASFYVLFRVSNLDKTSGSKPDIRWEK